MTDRVIVRRPQVRRSDLVAHVTGFAAAVALFCFSSCVFAQSKGDAARGEAKSAACAACHGTSKSPPLAGMPALGRQQPEFLVLQMFLIREGLRDVPEMRGMLNGWSDRDLGDVAAYFAAQTLPPANAKADAALHARGAALAQGMGCASCHFGNFEGQRQIPRIATQREDYLVASLKAYRDNKRTGIDTSMNAAMYQVSDADIAALAHYLAHYK
jgi:cytochrome c553